MRIRLNEFVMPPIMDGLVLGRLSPIGHVAVSKAIGLLSSTSFTHVPIEDDVISDVLVRSAILRKIPTEALQAYVLEEIKPLMGPEEILHLQIELAVVLEEKPK